MPDTFEKVAIQLSVNGKTHSLTVEPRMLLVELLREALDLTGTHVGCDTTYCGACTVIMNGLRERWQASSHSAGLWRFFRPAVRLLHSRADAFDLAVTLEEFNTERERCPQSHRGEYLPLHRLPERF